MYLISLNFWKTDPARYYTRTLIISDLISKHIGGAIEHDDSIIVIVDLVLKNVRKTSLNDEYTLRPATMNLVLQNDCICRVLPPKRNICLVVLIHLIPLNMSRRPLH